MRKEYIFNKKFKHKQKINKKDHSGMQGIPTNTFVSRISQ